MKRTNIPFAVKLFVILLTALGAVSLPPREVPIKTVRPFLIFYGGYPDTGTRALARHVADLFRGYPLVVFGDAWTFPDFAKKVQGYLPKTSFYGYADTGHVTFSHVAARLALLESMHFQGVLLDDVGTGLSASSKALQAAVDQAHKDHLGVMLNAWDPADVLPLHLVAGKDGILLENWVFSDGTWHSPRGKSVYAVLRTLERRGLLVFMGVTAKSAPVSPASMTLPVQKTVYWEFGGSIGVSGPYYSADSNSVFPAGALKSILAGLSY